MYFKGSICLLASLLISQQAAGSLFGSSDKNIIDKDVPNGEALVKLCSDASSRISKVSTITWLLEQLKSSDDFTCKQLYLEPLEALNQVTSSYADDVCSLDKVKLIDQFQWNYQMGAMSKKWAKFAKGPLPEPLKVFFLHYVSEITSTCKAGLPSSLGLAATQKDSSEDDASALGGDFGRIVDNFQKVIIPFDSIKHYDNFVLLWDMVINHERKKSNDATAISSSTSGENLVGLLKVKDASKVWTAQQKCRQILRPVYGNTILPVMKLIDMGYDLKDKQLDSEMRDNGELKNWYLITQTCELLLPIKFYQDDSMKFWDMGILDSSEEAKRYTEEPLDEQRFIELSQVKLPGTSLPDELKSFTSDDAKLLKAVKSNIKSRGHLFRKVFRGSMKNAMSKGLTGHKYIVSMLKKLKLTESKQQLTGDDDEIAKEALRETDELLREDEKLDNDETGLSRSKRGSSDPYGDDPYGLRRQRRRNFLFKASYYALLTGFIVGVVLVFLWALDVIG